MCRCAQANAPAASYWLRHVLDNGGRRAWTSSSCKGWRGRSLQSNVELWHSFFVSLFLTYSFVTLLRFRGLRNSPAILATLEIFDWH